MADNILTGIRRRLNKRKIGIFLEEQILEHTNPSTIHRLVSKVNELGKPKYSMFICEQRLSAEVHKVFEDMGFFVKVVPDSTIEINFHLEAYDKILSDDLDIVIFGTHRESMIPLFLESRTKAQMVFAFITNKVSEPFKNAVDEILHIDELEEYYFDPSGIEVNVTPSKKQGQLKQIEENGGGYDSILMSPVSEDFD